MTWVEGDSKAPFSIATTPGCRGVRYSFPKIAPLYPSSSPYSAECQAESSTIFWVFGMTTSLPNHWQTLYSLGQCHYSDAYFSTYTYVCVSVHVFVWKYRGMLFSTQPNIYIYIYLLELIYILVHTHYSLCLTLFGIRSPVWSTKTKLEKIRNQCSSWPWKAAVRSRWTMFFSL